MVTQMNGYSISKQDLTNFPLFGRFPPPKKLTNFMASIFWEAQTINYHLDKLKQQKLGWMILGYDGNASEIPRGLITIKKIGNNCKPFIASFIGKEILFGFINSEKHSLMVLSYSKTLSDESRAIAGIHSRTIQRELFPNALGTIKTYGNLKLSEDNIQGLLYGDGVALQSSKTESETPNSKEGPQPNITNNKEEEKTKPKLTMVTKNISVEPVTANLHVNKPNWSAAPKQDDNYTSDRDQINRTMAGILDKSNPNLKSADPSLTGVPKPFDWSKVKVNDAPRSASNAKALFKPWDPKEALGRILGHENQSISPNPEVNAFNWAKPLVDQSESNFNAKQNAISKILDIAKKNGVEGTPFDWSKSKVTEPVKLYKEPITDLSTDENLAKSVPVKVRAPLFHLKTDLGKDKFRFTTMMESAGLSELLNIPDPGASAQVISSADSINGDKLSSMIHDEGLDDLMDLIQSEMEPQLPQKYVSSMDFLKQPPNATKTIPKLKLGSALLLKNSTKNAPTLNTKGIHRKSPLKNQTSQSPVKAKKISPNSRSPTKFSKKKLPGFSVKIKPVPNDVDILDQIDEGNSSMEEDDESPINDLSPLRTDMDMDTPVKVGFEQLGIDKNEQNSSNINNFSLDQQLAANRSSAVIGY
jgi:hypothetical protein